MKKKAVNVVQACRDEATAARAQVETSRKRAETLRAVASARRAAALVDDERADGLRREAVLSEREAVNHEDMARVFQAEAERADSQADAEQSIVERKSVERRKAWPSNAGASRRQPATRASKGSSKASGKRATSTSETTSARH